MLTALAPGRALGRYTIQGPLGETAWAATYAAADDGRSVALKIVDPIVARQPGVLEELRRIRDVLAGLPGHVILATEDEGEDADGAGPFLVSPLSADPSLADLVEIFPLSPEESVGAILSLAVALDAAHAAGIAHLALKPTNIFVGPPPSHDVRVGDFGANVLRRASATLHEKHDSLAWLAPEQLDPEAPPTPASDVFVAALLAFFAMTGKPPWRHADDADDAALAAEIRQKITKPSELAMELGGDIPSALDEPLMKALDPAPADRFASVGAFALALSGALDAARREDKPVAREGVDTDSASTDKPPPAARHIKATQKLTRFSQLDAIAPHSARAAAAGATAKMGKFELSGAPAAHPAPKRTQRLARFGEAPAAAAAQQRPDPRAHAATAGVARAGNAPVAGTADPASPLAPVLAALRRSGVPPAIAAVLAVLLCVTVAGVVVWTCSARAPAVNPPASGPLSRPPPARP